MPTSVMLLLPILEMALLLEPLCIAFTDLSAVPGTLAERWQRMKE